MTQNDLEKEKKNLVEELGITLEHEHLAPVAARILVILILEGSQGMTFEGLVDALNASKSTISTHLDQMQATGKVEYFTKPGDRKRYFIINPDLMIRRMDQMISDWEREIALNEKILNFKTKWNKLHQKEDDFQHDLEFQKAYLSIIKEGAESIEKLRKKINKKHLTNHNR